VHDIHNSGLRNARPVRDVYARSTPTWRFTVRKLFLTLTLASAPFVVAHGQQAPTDPQIADIVVTANQVDIDAGRLAQKGASAREVRDFGKQMVTDHTAVNKQATALVRKLKVTPEANSTSSSLKQGGDDNMSKLKKLKGKEFDRAYVDNEVTYHQAVIDAVDKTLLPSAKNAELKTLIEKVRPALVQHLEHAKSLQAKLGQ
jgi:putative membrane protein